MTPFLEISEKEYKTFSDHRGNLKVVQFDSELPFTPKRIFTISGVLNNQVRGGHAHKKCHQAIMVITGELDLELTDGTENMRIRIGQESKTLWIKPGTWVSMENFTNDCVVLVFASDNYDHDDYIDTISALQDFNIPLEGK